MRGTKSGRPVFIPAARSKCIRAHASTRSADSQTGLGWDTLDEALAMMLGFRSRSFRHIRAYHHRPQGSAGGYLKGNLAAGRAAYNVGYSSAVPDDARGGTRAPWPPVIGGIDLLAGYLEGYLRRNQKTAVARAGQVHSPATDAAASDDGVGMALSSSSAGRSCGILERGSCEALDCSNDAFVLEAAGELSRPTGADHRACEPLIRPATVRRISGGQEALAIGDRDDATTGSRS